MTNFAVEIRAGVEHATPLERRRIFQILKLTGTVHLDPEHKIKFANRNRYTVRWTGVIPLGSDIREVVSVQTVWIGPTRAVALPGVTINLDRIVA